MKIFWYSLLLFFLATLIFFIPFFWLKPGEMDLGGDNSRLYFYDPLSYLTSQSLYSVSHSGLGGENLSFYAIPFFLLLAFVKSLIHTPTILIGIFHGLNLSVGFTSCYFIIKELLKQEKEGYTNDRLIIESSSLLAGLYYTFSLNPIHWWGYPLLPMNLVFLNPLLFFILLRFFLTQRITYMLLALLITFVFSPNFGYIGAPTFFSFFPLAMLFLILYTKYIRKRAIPIAKIAVGLLLFVCLHAFHLVPQLTSILTPGTDANAFIFGAQGKLEWGLKYFLGNAPAIKVIYSLLGLIQFTKPEWYWSIFILFPLLFVLGFLWNKTRVYLLSGMFMLVTLFLETANITHIGLKLYALAFQIPGFSMFRVYYGQWQWAYLFFYTLLFGQALAIVMEKIKPILRYLLLGSLVIVLMTTSLPFISGKLTDTTLWQSKNIKSHVKIDPTYNDVLTYLRALPVDGKIISFPLNDSGYQVLKGENEAAYVGPSTITYLAARNEFNSIAEFGIFGSGLLAAAREKNYTKLKNIFTILNIRYIFYNEDPYIFGDNFPGMPYGNVRNFFPDTQVGYKELINNLGVKEIKTIAGKFHVYEIDDKDYLPHVYVARNNYLIDQPNKDMLLPLDVNDVQDKRIAFYNLNDAHVIDDSRYGIIRLAKSKYNYLSALLKPVDPIKDVELLSLENKIRELEDNKAKWDRVFTEYLNIVKNLIKILDSMGDNSIALEKKIKLKGLLVYHEIMTYKAIVSNQSIVLKEKEKMIQDINSIFDKSNEAIDIDIPNPTVSDYFVDIPADRTYEIYGINDVDMFNNSSIGLTIDGKALRRYSTKEKNNLLRFEDIFISKKNSVSVSLNNSSYVNHVEDSEWHPISGKEIDPKSITFTLNGVAGNREGLFRQINFVSNAPYYISFEYNTNGQNYLANIYELVKSAENKSRITANRLYRDNLRSYDWKKFNAVIQTGNDPETALILQILLRENTEDDLLFTKSVGKIIIRNLTAIRIPQTQILFRSLSQTNPSDTLIPSVTFTKVNPTKYIISVRNAQKPYTLVFLQNFNKNWKLINPNKTSSNVTIVPVRLYSALLNFISDIFSKERKSKSVAVNQYFEKDVTEVDSSDIFFDNQTLSTFGKASVAESKHRLVNGYANAWDIEPKDFDGKTEYTFVVEMVSQQLFYFSSLISIATLACCLVWLGMIGYKNIFQTKNEDKI
ncbi:hypothetical protein HY409_01285 [Candidatus Gottesmanbacteria bacterium]|nr:hypothetical protein [Candidatus Gottesmanbacteria bacterium]